MGSHSELTVNQADLAWVTERSTGGEVVCHRRKLAAATAGRALGCGLYRVPPGAPSWPRHYHTANEEAIYVLSGTGSLLVGDDELPLRAGDYVALPVGAEYAHKVKNDTDTELVFLCFSQMVEPDVVVYPDSGKVGLFVGVAPGGSPADVKLKTFLRLDATVDYWAGEEDAGSEGEQR
jgi:uncharacterized cupin superfamily protein